MKTLLLLPIVLGLTSCGTIVDLPKFDLGGTPVDLPPITLGK